MAGSISVQPVARRRPTKPLDEASLNDFSYEYKVQVVCNGKVEEMKYVLKHSRHSLVLQIVGCKLRRILSLVREKHRAIKEEHIKIDPIKPQRTLTMP